MRESPASFLSTWSSAAQSLFTWRMADGQLGQPTSFVGEWMSLWYIYVHLLDELDGSMNPAYWGHKHWMIIAQPGFWAQSMADIPVPSRRPKQAAKHHPKLDHPQFTQSYIFRVTLHLLQWCSQLYTSHFTLQFFGIKLVALCSWPRWLRCRT